MDLRPTAPDDGGDAVDLLDLPRAQAGSHPQHLMVSLLGEYWSGRDEHLPSATLVDLVGEFDVSLTSARAALSRLSRRGMLSARKVGRRTFYTLSPSARNLLAARRASLLGADRPPRPRWDGSWTVVTFSVPEDRRDVRHSLRNGLRWLGFAPLYDGVWASPSAAHQQAVELLDRLDVPQATVFRASVAHPEAGTGHPLAVWNLDGLAADLEDFAARARALLGRVRAGDVDPSEALRERTTLIAGWRSLASREPDLPPDLLPDGWPGPAAQAAFAETADALGPLAEARFREIVTSQAPELGPLVSHQRAASAVS